MSVSTENEQKIRDFITNNCDIHEENDYHSKFINNQYTSMDRIKFITDKKDLEEIGIQSPGHKTMIMAAINRFNSSDKNETQKNKSGNNNKEPKKDKRYVRLCNTGNQNKKIAVQLRSKGKSYIVFTGNNGKKNYALKDKSMDQWNDYYYQQTGDNLPGELDYEINVAPGWKDGNEQKYIPDLKTFFNSYNARNKESYSNNSEYISSLHVPQPQINQDHYQPQLSLQITRNCSNDSGNISLPASAYSNNYSAASAPAQNYDGYDPNCGCQDCQYRRVYGPIHNASNYSNSVQQRSYYPYPQRTYYSYPNKPYKY